MKNTLRFLLLLLLTAAGPTACKKNNPVGKTESPVYPVTLTPVERFGRLQVLGTQLCDEKGDPVQLRGMSTHGLQWFRNCYTEAAFESLAEVWRCSVVRLALYVEEGGYNTDPEGFRERIETMVRWCGELGVYCLIDWHILTPGAPDDPAYAGADEFFAWASERFGGQPHVLYEICNEPNGTGAAWRDIKRYAERIVPIIRRNAPESIVICGTPVWSSRPQEAASDPLKFGNILYAFHFYAATHTDYDGLESCLDRIPVFVTEWGVSQASGDGRYDLEATDRWLAILNGANAGNQLVSWAAWNFSDGDRITENLQAGSCAACRFSEVKEPCGRFVMERIIGEAAKNGAE